MIPRWIEFSAESSSLVFGPRRAGKTTLLKMRYPDVAYRTLDDYDYLDLARKDPKRFCDFPEKTLIIDEVQRVPELLIAVKYAIDELGKVFLMTGSSSLGLISSGADTLAGRVNLIECPTFCWGEEQGPPTHRVFEMPPDPLQIREADRKLSQAMTFGGFPEVVIGPDEENKTAVLRNYRDTYFTKDLLLLSSIENAAGLMAILAYLSVSLGSHLEVSNASRESGLSYPTTKKYLNVLVESRLAFKLVGYQYGPAKRFTRASKVYFSDAGMLHALNVSVSAGQRLENFVISELEKRRKLGAIQCDRLCYYKSAAGAEIDVIMEMPDETLAVEIKHTRNPVPRDVRQLQKFVAADPGKRRAILLYTGTERQDIEGIDVLPVQHLYRAL
jgi:predicted AAA+ superfamily ATPase